MSDLSLLLFGCVVSFIAVAGAYVYLRECWTVEDLPKKPNAKPEGAAKTDIRDVA